MKSVIDLLKIVLIVGAGYYFMEHYFPSVSKVEKEVTKVVDKPFGKDDAFKLDIMPVKLPKDITVKNNSNTDLRLHVFFANDAVKGIAKYNDVVKIGQSKTYPRDNYVFNIWKFQIFDAHIKWSDTINTNVTISGTDKSLSITNTEPSIPTRISNETDEQLKVCTYNAGDAVQAIPLKCWAIGKANPIEWLDAPKKFIVKVFSPALLDSPLVSQSDVAQSSRIIIQKK